MTTKNDKMSRRLSWCVLMIFLSLSGRARAEDLLTEDVANRIESAVRDSLRDPNSATFKDVTALRVADGKIEVCGLVNAKNGFGGYVGYKGFFATIERGQVNLIGILSDNWSSDAEARQLLLVSQGCERVFLAKLKKETEELKTE